MCVSRTEAIPFLQLGEKNKGISVTNLYLQLPQSCFSRILDNVSKKLMEILLEIDEKVGNIDDLDVRLTDEKQSELNKKINIAIDSFVNIGDNNSFAKTNIAGSEIEKDK